MKLISLLALYFLMQSTFAATYYFSATDGDDNRMATQAQNSTTPWKTLGKLNAIFSSLKPGDKVLLKRGDTFVGSIYPNVSGTAGLPILISAYGTGNKPVISGLTTLTNWMSLSNGIWENADPGFGTSVNVVLINGVPQNIGRYPNISSTNGGYLTFESHNSTNSITDNQLTATTNWTGGEVVIRKVRWVLDRNIITSHTTNTLNYTSASVYQPVNNFGYFIQNHPKTLDLVGEWYFNSTLKKLGIYFKTDSPSSYTIKASQVKNLVALYNQKYISLDNLKFEGANEKAIDINNVSDITIKNCEISFSGINAITGLNSAKIAISNSIISNTNNNAVILYNCSNSAITDNNISNTGAVAGMGQSGDGNYNAISIEGSNNLIQYNQIKNTGYIPIYFEGSSTIVQNNFIDRYAFIKDDAGGIYLFNGPSTTTTYTGRKILANIILNGIGTPAGTDNPALSHACGIFLDNKVSGVEIRDNTMANAANKGILILYSNKVIMKNNTLYNNKIQLSMRETNSNQVYNNIFFSKLPTQIVSHIDATKNDIGNYGSFDSNYYARPMDDDMVIYSAYVNSTGKKIIDGLNLARWQLKYNKDKTSKTSPLKYPAYKVNSLIGSNKFYNGSFNTDIKGVSTYSSLNNLAASFNSGGVLDGGCLQVSFNPPSGTSTSSSSLVMVNVGTVSSSKKYILKFSLKGSNDNVSINAYLRNYASPYNNLTEPQYRKITSTRTENEVLFSFPTSASATLVFRVDNQDIKFWLDNIKFYEADATITNPDDYIRFEYNATKVNKTVTLSSSYVDVKNKSYSSSVILKPYTSIILLKKTTSARDIEQTQERRNTVEGIELKAYPTPFKSFTTVQVIMPEAGAARLEVVDLQGRIVRSLFNGIAEPGTQKRFELKAEGLSEGIYIIRFITKTKIISQKILLSR